MRETMHTYLDEHRDEIVRQFVGTSVWTGLMLPGDGGEMTPLDDHVDADWLTDTDDFPSIRDEMAGMVDDFLEFLSEQVSEAEIRAYVDATGTDVSIIGHDFALTREGQGAGFWDRGAGELGTRLTDIAKTYRGEGLTGEMDPNGESDLDFALYFD